MTDKEVMQQALPCPFCASTRSFKSRRFDRAEIFRVGCNVCTASVAAPSKDAAIAAWNRRQPQHSAQSAPSITMQDAIDAGDGALHGAIDYWQSKCEELEKKLAQSAQPAEVQPTPRRAYGEDYLEGVNVDRLERALTQLGVATCEREEMAARMAGYVNEITAAVMRHCEFLQSKPVEVQRVGTDMDAAAKVFADCMDYPWDFMTEQGRDWMRANTQSVLDAAHGITPATKVGDK